MESKLYEAAGKGNVPELLELLARDKQVLDRFMIRNHAETPLHIAAMLGHLEFVREVLTRKPELARVQNSQGSTPLHLAAAKGYFEIVENLLKVSPEVCFVRDKYEKNPLHVAAMKGQVSVLDCLVRVRPDAARIDVEHGQTILHLCVKHNRLEALERLINVLNNDQFINSTDDQGNTILHLAAADRQNQTMSFLRDRVNPGSRNCRGFTASDLLAQGESEERKREAESERKREAESEERKRKAEDNMRNMLMVVAILVATIAFEAGRETDYFKERGENAGSSSKNQYADFIACNTISFITSLSVIMLLISGVPLGRRIPIWIVMLTMWVAITFQAATYSIVIEASCPEESYAYASSAGQTVVLVWIGLMALIVLYHVVHMIRKYLKNKRGCISNISSHKLLQACSSLKKCCEP